MRRAEALRLLFPAGARLLPVGQRVAGRLRLAPAGARRFDRGFIVAIEHVDAAGKIGDVVGFDAVDEEQDRRAVRVFGMIAEPDRMRRGIAVTCRAVRQKACVVIGPEERAQMFDTLRRGGADHNAVALRAGALQQTRQRALERCRQQVIEADISHYRLYLSTRAPWRPTPEAKRRAPASVSPLSTVLMPRRNSFNTAASQPSPHCSIADNRSLRNAACGRRASSCASSFAAESAAPRSTRRLTSPMRSASSPEMPRPVRIRSIARLWPIRRGSRIVPRSISGTPNRRQYTPKTASRAATRRSHQSASSSPPATAGPSIAAMTGFDNF